MQKSVFNKRSKQQRRTYEAIEEGQTDRRDDGEIWQVAAPGTRVVA